ncbi:hypothetical protein F3Y22_tig00001644pilonHSYRG00700 [Hibiscus syriacus]|uniref:Uncharacterized protein n=1 Tax=Hibiscus syriacus TaxID=106335 RepID=A0A6A3CU73_HIBSY|nr:hypothetical protein F3Y22_tig00001644pilonHSYRG00700 [Hibiscus syriacus]
MTLGNFYKEDRFPSDEMKEKLAVQIGGGQHDHSSGVIQDHVSGLRQDSSGSIKLGDYGYMIRGRNPYDMCHSAKLTKNGAIVHTNPSSKSMGYKPSGYLKVKGVSENPVIIAVKRQLGRHYREDGPVLSIQFDPLPPGAFEFPSSHPVSELISVRDSRQDSHPYISGVMKHPKPKIDSYMKGETSTLKDSLIDIYKVYADKPAVNECQRSRMSSKLAVGRIVSDSFSNYPVFYSEKITNEQESPGSHDDDSYLHSPKACLKLQI